ncbi:hypothetical protein ACKS0A_10623 [Histoplasma ohiense]
MVGRNNELGREMMQSTEEAILAFLQTAYFSPTYVLLSGYRLRTHLFPSVLTLCLPDHQRFGLQKTPG